MKTCIASLFMWVLCMMYPLIGLTQSESRLTDLEVDSFLLIDTEKHLQKAMDMAMTLEYARFLPLGFYTEERQKLFRSYSLYGFKLLPNEKNILWSEMDQTQLNIMTGEVIRPASKPSPVYHWDSWNYNVTYTLPKNDDTRWDSIQFCRGNYLWSDEFIWIIKGTDTLRLLLHLGSNFSYNYPFFWITSGYWHPRFGQQYQKIHCYDALQHSVQEYIFRIPNMSGEPEHSFFGSAVHESNVIWFCDIPGIWGFDKVDRNLYYYPMNVPKGEWEFLGTDSSLLYFAHSEKFLAIKKNWFKISREKIKGPFEQPDSKH